MSPVKSDALVTYFTTRAQEKNPDFKPNRQSMHFTFRDILKDYTTDEAKALIDFYFDHYQHPTHDFKSFRYGYDEIAEEMEKRQAEIEYQKRLAEETRERTLRWKERFARTQDDSGNA